MQAFLGPDTRFYFAIGAFTIAVFVLGLAVLAVVYPGFVDVSTMAALTVGFLVYMLVYFVSISVQRLEDGDGV
ncbi:hypothetical protein [Natrialbaceae archaeon AArc-T1-2]|uniref:hypothetical protein n=1 Tax=Natrialbaceae archaeon AArc-T1-2 TaxID=3053904 RepID=UPI00255AE8E9|nr:hypothetical protein [Natrialbaceae archaeon AArc-T1-2]WIV68385.1 hypothetical protein QQ977_06595 [Natrialbaceae archaeon AArc-T1-2]